MQQYANECNAAIRARNIRTLQKKTQITCRYAKNVQIRKERDSASWSLTRTFTFDAETLTSGPDHSPSLPSLFPIASFSDAPVSQLFFPSRLPILVPLSATRLAAHFRTPPPSRPPSPPLFLCAFGNPPFPPHSPPLRSPLLARVSGLLQTSPSVRSPDVESAPFRRGGRRSGARPPGDAARGRTREGGAQRRAQAPRQRKGARPSPERVGRKWESPATPSCETAWKRGSNADANGSAIERAPSVGRRRYGPPIARREAGEGTGGGRGEEGERVWGIGIGRGGGGGSREGGSGDSDVTCVRSRPRRRSVGGK